VDRRIPLAGIGLFSVVLVAVLLISGNIPIPNIKNPTLPSPNSTTPPTPGANWTRLSTTASPATTSSMMAYVPTTHEIILVDSGRTCGSSSTWAFVGGAWENLTPLVGPGPNPARGSGGMVYDGADGYLVLFGGSSPCGVYNDTWTFANGTWTRLSTPAAPPPLYRFAMTYDASDGYVLLTGGCCIGGQISRETWSFEHGNWTNLTQSPSPIVDLDSAMTFDSTLGEVVFVGGYASGYVSQATWTFHGGLWTRLYPTISPSNRAGMGFAYDEVLAGDVLVGGYTKITQGVYVNLTDTWTYESGHWQNATAALTASPPFVSGPALMSYDPGRQQIVLFLGYDQTWVFG
jgi:hypothetical protein